MIETDQEHIQRLNQQAGDYQARIVRLEAECAQLRLAMLEIIERKHSEETQLIERAERAEAWVLEGGMLSTAQMLEAERDKLKEALIAYQDNNRIHNDGEAILHELGRAALAAQPNDTALDEQMNKEKL